MRIIVADCSAEYSGRLNASLPPACRVILIKADNSLLIFSELGSYKPLNWMAAPCVLKEIDPEPSADAAGAQDAVGADGAQNEPGAQNELGVTGVAIVADEPGADAAADTDGPAASGPGQAAAKKSAGLADDDGATAPQPVRILRAAATKSSDVLEVTLLRIYSDQTFDLGEDPGLNKDGVEDHLQRYLAEQIDRIGEGSKLVRREYPTAIGPVDIMAIDAEGRHVAIEIKRHGNIDGVEQLTRYCELLNRDPLLAPVRGIFAAQTIAPQARTLAHDRGFDCLILDYDEMKGRDPDELRLF